MRSSSPVLLVLVLGLAAGAACNRNPTNQARAPHPTAPADWAARRGVQTGDPAGAQPVDPRDQAATLPRDTQKQRDTSTVLVIALVAATAIGISAGVWVLESRRRRRRNANSPSS